MDGASSTRSEKEVRDKLKDLETDFRGYEGTDEIYYESLRSALHEMYWFLEENPPEDIK